MAALIRFQSCWLLVEDFVGAGFTGLLDGEFRL
jgi:hypothetical protein